MDQEKDSNPAGEQGSSSGASQRDFVAEKGAQNKAGGPSSRFSRAAGGAKSFMGSKNAKIGGAGAGIAGLIIAAFLALLPLKLEAIMKNIFQKRVGDKIEHMQERRTDRIIIKYLTKAGSGEAVYADGTLFGSLYKNWRLKNFEGKFSAKSGIKIEKLPNGGGIKLTPREGLGPKTLTEAQFEEYLNNDLKGVDARRFIRDVTRSETHWIQVYKRHNLRKFMKNAYGIHKWSWFRGKEGEKGASQIDDALIDTDSDRGSKDAGRALGCALDGQDCPNDKSARDKPYGNNSIDKPNTSTGDDSVKEDTDSSFREARDEVKKLSPKKRAEKALSKVLSKFLSEKLSAKLTTKAIPILGQILLIDQISRIDHFFREGTADDTLRSIHKVQYATKFASFLSINDNMKDPFKKMSGDEVNIIMSKFNGAESESAAFHEVLLNQEGGKTIDPNLGVNDKAQPIKEDYTKYFPAANPNAASLILWYKFMKATYISKLIDAINYIIEKLVGGLVKLALDLMETIVPQLRSLMSAIGTLSGKLLLKIIVPAVDGTETGAELMNAIDAGGAVTGQDFSKSLGGHKLSETQSYQENQAIAFDQNLASPSLRDQIFSTQYHYSMVNRMAAVVPSSGGAAVSQFSNYSIGMMKSPLSIFNGFINFITGKAHAGAPTNLYGLQNYGFTEEELDAPLTTLTDRNKDGKIDAEDCKTNEDGKPFSEDQRKAFDDPSKPQLCLLDVATAESLGSVFTDANDGGLDESGSGSPASPAGANSGQLPSGTAAQLAQQLLDNPKVTKSGRLVVQDLQATAKGQAGSSGAPLSQTLLAILAKIAESHSFDITALESGGTGHAATSLHYTGDAFDFRAFDGAETNGRDAASVALLNILGTLLPSGSGVGQVNCPGAKPNLPSYIAQFDDTCTHLHVQIPRGTQ